MKKSQAKKNIFLNVNNIVKQDCLVNMIYGTRGAGKTYGFLKYLKENYIKTGKGAIYLRRYKNELRTFKNILNKLFINNDFLPEDKIKYNKTDKEFIDIDTNKPVLKGVLLSQGIILKSSEFDKYNMIIFDEFIIDKGNYQYIPDEFETFHNFIETVSRMRELTDNEVVKVYMLANSASRNNPYFINYNIPITNKNPYIKNDLLVYQVEAQDFIEEKLKTRWGKFVKNNTKMMDYMMLGNFNDKNDFISSLPSQSYYIATLIYLSKKIGIYKSKKDDIIYISDKINNNFKLVFSLTKDDATPDIISINANKKLLDILKKYYENSQLRFTDLKLQAIFVDILKIL